MISRMILSLRKAADSRQNSWFGNEERTTSSTGRNNVRYSRLERDSDEEDTDDILFDTYHESQTHSLLGVD